MGEDETIEAVLASSRVIAIVGLSDRPDRSSHGVARYLQREGYRIIPVNPNFTGPVLGEQPYPSLDDLPEPVDLIDIFRRSEDVPPVVDAAIRIGAPAVWMQLGIVHQQAALLAKTAGINVVMDRCTAIEHRRLVWLGKLNTNR
jgi:predicted CoA-binding protein